MITAHEDFTWGQSIGANGRDREIRIPVNRGDDYIGDVVIGPDDARVLADMLHDFVDEVAGEDAADALPERIPSRGQVEADV